MLIYELSLNRAVDSGSPVVSGTATITITLTDVNDNDPTFAQTMYSVTANQGSTAGGKTHDITVLQAKAISVCCLR